MPLDRRQFITMAAALPLAGCHPREPIRGEIVGANHALGHRIRDGKMPQPTSERRRRVVVVGAGVSGLAAARHLYRRGMRDLAVLELESEIGGNAASGRNAVSAYPWGAHYVPIPGADAGEVVQLFRELGVITGVDERGRPIYREDFLCHDPTERLFALGHWQEGLVPQVGLSPEESRQMEAFLREMAFLKNQMGADGRPAFTIPLDASSADESFRRWDGITMAAWMHQRGYSARPLKWYVNYCCRDDFGAGMDRVSAWAGIHYFAARRGEAANAPSYSVVTWPEGNGWLVERLREGLTEHISCGSAVWAIRAGSHDVELDVFEASSGQSVRYRADVVLMAIPRFIARRLIPDLAPEPVPTYGPWMVANLTLTGIPINRGVPMAWDNVVYESPSLGYVMATHQSLASHPFETVLTYYLPLDQLEPAAAREVALNRTHTEWCELILGDLTPIHPDLRSLVARIDVKVWGHGMVVPTPGYIWGGARQALSHRLGAIHFAHTDLSGISLFEEAYCRGCATARRMAEALGMTG